MNGFILDIRVRPYLLTQIRNGSPDYPTGWLDPTVSLFFSNGFFGLGRTPGYCPPLTTIGYKAGKCHYLHGKVVTTVRHVNPQSRPPQWQNYFTS